MPSEAPRAMPAITFADGETGRAGKGAADDRCQALKSIDENSGMLWSMALVLEA